MSVCQRSQTAGRNSCSLVSGNVSNCSHRLTVLSRVRVSVRPSIFFICEKLQKSLANRVASASVYFNESPIGHCLASVGKRTETVISDGRVWGCACARDVFAIYVDNILSRLIMIIIKIIILYFIQIRHTDDFPSAGIPASKM